MLTASLFIFLGGGIGSLFRFLLTKLGQSIIETKFPIGTLFVNATACLILGLTVYLLKDKIESNDFVKYFIVIGFCGGFSTFSTFGFETINLFKDGLLIYGLLNILISLILGFSILWALIK